MSDRVLGPGGGNYCVGCKLKWIRLPGSYAELLEKGDIPRRWCEETRGMIHVTRLNNVPWITDQDRADALDVILRTEGAEAAEQLVLAWASEDQG